uniref:Putative secreted protein n=1 Tax=Anopheles darlingi TaxID=43151 RepID=A0A2M4DKP7_ANODA
MVLLLLLLLLGVMMMAILLLGVLLLAVAAGSCRTLHGHSHGHCRTPCCTHHQSVLIRFVTIVLGCRYDAPKPHGRHDEANCYCPRWNRGAIVVCPGIAGTVGAVEGHCTVVGRCQSKGASLVGSSRYCSCTIWPRSSFARRSRCWWWSCSSSS